MNNSTNATIDGTTHFMKPDISDLAQVTSFFELLLKEKAIFDICYIKKRGILLDLSIIWKTVKAIFAGDGAQ